MPKMAKEVRQMLGLTGYCCKFIPAHSDLIRSLTQLTHKTVSFTLTYLFQKAFDLLKEALIVYPDSYKPYMLFTDASKYAWFMVLT